MEKTFHLGCMLLGTEPWEPGLGVGREAAWARPLCSVAGPLKPGHVHTNHLVIVQILIPEVCGRVRVSDKLMDVLDV